MGCGSSSADSAADDSYTTGERNPNDDRNDKKMAAPGHSKTTTHPPQSSPDHGRIRDYGIDERPYGRSPVSRHQPQGSKDARRDNPHGPGAGDPYRPGAEDQFCRDKARAPSKDESNSRHHDQPPVSGSRWPDDTERFRGTPDRGGDRQPDRRNPAHLYPDLPAQDRADERRRSPLSPVLSCMDGLAEEDVQEYIPKDAPYKSIDQLSSRPIRIREMEQDVDTFLMIKPFKYNPSRSGQAPEPVYSSYKEESSDSQVLMPCSGKNVNEKGKPQWPEMQERLRNLQKNCSNPQNGLAILKETIQSFVGSRLNLQNLDILINSHYQSAEREYFFQTLLPNMCMLAFNVDTTCGQAPCLLTSGSNKSVTMSQKQAASLLACGFFCMFPGRSNLPHGRPGSSFPDPNFHRLFANDRPSKIEKLKCMLHYFKRITQKMPDGVLTFQRVSIRSDQIPKWPESKQRLADLILTSGRKIEDIPGVLQVDFANKYIGGGVLGSGAVQEEIRFTICPEMLVSLLLCERMNDDESIFLIGCERYSQYKGYAETFQFAGDYQDTTAKDNWARKWCHVVAIDAIFFRNPSTQYEITNIKRELIKAFVGFCPIEDTAGVKGYGIATGHWGCGAFNGDKQLKSLIQLMAASEAGRPLLYAAVGDGRFVKELAHVYDCLKGRRATVRDLYAYLTKYSETHGRGDRSLFDMILRTELDAIRS